MPHSFGYRARTRKKFRRPFRQNGTLPTSTYLRTFNLGQIVDVVGVGSQQKGMPHKYYHGRTGKVWNVTPRAVGVEINKQVRGRIIKKRVHVRIEHVRPSNCRKDFEARVKSNDEKRREAAKNKLPCRMFFSPRFFLIDLALLKRQPAQPAPAHFVKNTSPVETLTPIRYVLLV